MGYREQLQQARELLQVEIMDLRLHLAAKEQDLRKLDGLIKEPASILRRQQSLTSQVVEALYLLVQEAPDGVPARAVVEEFGKQRDDVNESTIRSTLYQVTRKLRPTAIKIDENVKNVRVYKNGPLYDVELVAKETP